MKKKKEIYYFLFDFILREKKIVFLLKLIFLTYFVKKLFFFINIKIKYKKKKKREKNYYKFEI